MQSHQVLALLKKKSPSIIFLGMLVATLSFWILLMKEENFKVSTDYLIVQNNSSNQDYYTLSKSSEYIGKVLKEGTYSELFIDEVIKTGKVNSEFLPFNKKDKLEQWSKKVQVNLNQELGIINVYVFDDNQKQAQSISEAVSEVMTKKNNLFRGEGQDMEIKIMSGPVTEKNPSIANIVAVLVAGFVLGIMIMSLWYIIKEDQRKKKVISTFAPNDNILQNLNSFGNNE